MSLKIGITGGIGSGKTSVTKLFAKKGCPVLYADDIAKKILVENSEVKAKIISSFGSGAYEENKANKKYLADKIFNNPENLAFINSIVHPPTIKKISDLCREELVKTDLVFVESALIYEADLVNIFDYIIVVTAAEDIRIDRICKRDSSIKESVMERIKNQFPEEKKISRADFVIYNEKSIAELERKVDLFLSIFKSMAK